MVSIQGLTSLIPTLGGLSYSQWLTANFPLAGRWDHQDLSGSSVLEASYTTALDFGRSVALKTYGDYVAGANWANSSGQIARHSAGSVETFQQDDILAPGKTYQVTITLANRTAGSVTITDGGAAISANEETTRTITSTGTDFIITPTTDFDGDIDVAIILVQQTGIAASSDFPGAELYVTANAASDPNGNEADATTGWAEDPNAVLTSDSAVKDTGSFSIKLVVIGAGGRITFNLDSSLTIGKSYFIRFRIRHLGSGGICNSYLAATQGGTNNFLVSLDSSDTTFQEVTKAFVHSAATRFLTIRELNATDDGGAYIDNISITEANPMNGTTTAAQVGVPTNFGSLGLSVVDDGATSFSDIHSAEINSKFNPAAGFLNIWGKVRAASVWTDGVQRFIIGLRVNGSNFAQLTKNGANNELFYSYNAAGNRKDEVIATSTLDYFLATMTWDTDADQVKYYLNGILKATDTNLGTWVGNQANNSTVIGAITTSPNNVWDGSRTRFMLGYEAITPAQVLSIYNQGRR